MSEKNNDEIGALWVKQSAKGQYMTGTIEVDGKKIGIVCFINQHKKEAKHPDWRVLKAIPKSRDAAQPMNNPNPEMQGINPEDIPF